MRILGSVKTITQPTKETASDSDVSTTPLVRAKVVAKALDVHERTVTLWAQNGTIPCRRIAGTVRFNLQEVMGAVK